MPDIRHSIHIASKAATVYPLTATADGFAQWWAADVIEVDGAVNLGFFNRSTVYRLGLKVNQPPARAERTCETGDEWNGTRIAFELENRGAGTFLRSTHGGWRSETEYFMNCNTTWGELMYRLKAAADGKSRGPLFLANELAY